MKILPYLICLLFVVPAIAATTPSQPTTKKKTTQSGALSTNVIGSQEAPTVLNVVPWKDQQITLKSYTPTSRLLNQVLQPLDVNVLDREIEYYHLLNKKSSDNNLFLSQ
jgi:hypothetical protein